MADTNTNTNTNTDTGTGTATATAIHDPATTHPPKPEGEPRSPPPATTTTASTTTAPTKTDEPPVAAPAPPPPPPTPQTDTPRLDRLPRPKVQAKIRTTMQRDDISAHEAQRRHLNNERNRRTRQRKIEREIASGVRHRDGRVRRSRERPWC